MERILFIVPPPIKFNDFVNPSYNGKVVWKNNRAYGNVVTGMPLGLMSLSSYVKKYADAETKLLDFTVVLNKLEKFDYESFSAFFKEYLSSSEFSRYNPTLIGISALFAPAYRNLLDIIKACGEIFPDAVIVAGGGVPQNMYSHIFREAPGLHGICYGEGEKPLLNLIKASDKLAFMEASSSWITPNKTEKALEHDFVEDLDDIPFYDYDLCNVSDYSINPGYDGRCNATMGAQGNFSIMTSRGCLHRCTFCASYTVHGRRMRYHSIARVGEDLKLLKEKYGASTLVFQDDYFMGNTERVYEIIDKMKELNFNAIFQNGLNLYALDRPMLEALRNVGVKHLTLPVESGSQRVLKEIMKKPLMLQTVKQVVDDCRSLGIYTNVSILIGMPGETKQDIEDARLFLKDLGANWVGFLIATPLPGTEMLETCLENNYLVDDYIDTDYKKAIVRTGDFTPEYITEKAYTLNLELNFVNNADYRLGQFETALIGYENAINAKRDHALAHYYAGKCYEKLGDSEKAKEYINTAKSIVDEQLFWRKYFEMFNIAL